MPVSVLKGVGPALQQNLAAAGAGTIAQLLTRYPRDWEDRSRAVPLADWNTGPVCTAVTVLAHDWFGFGTMKTLKIHVEDESARAVLVCFNRPFLQKQFPVGGRFRLWGRFSRRYGELQSTFFELETSGTEGAILPVYPLKGRLTQNMLRRLVKEALDKYGALDDEIPPDTARAEKLLPKAQAQRAIHFPPSLEILCQARNTLIYEELFFLEVAVCRRSLERRSLTHRPIMRGEASPPAPSLDVRAYPPGRAPVHQATPPPPSAGESPPAVTWRGDYPVHTPSYAPPPSSVLQKRLVERLPFALTAGQKAAVKDINADMDSSVSMARLLQGDVGSGKTLVSFIAALKVVEQGGQAAIMAPTELLARQHADNAARLLEPLGVRPAYLTGNLKAAGRARLLSALAAGEIDIVLGTHALFSKDVVYRNLALVIIDEQHRFGVTQRQAIIAKGQSSLRSSGVPHLLMMSATPIPRTLALTVFGDLDVSVIRDMPPGRKPVKTHLARESNAGKVYDFVGKELAAGRQAYFVYPLIGGEDEPESGPPNSTALKDVVSMAERLSKTIFPRYSTALVHSKLDDEAKRSAMEAFRRGETRILAATSVVEVGVDVPNASCMVIHHAERFGLSALHQLRGRVGRGQEQAYCFLIYSEPETEPGRPDTARPPGEGLTGDGKQRLKVMLESNDGFVIAEEDLKLRGPGQIAGIEQSGYLTLGIADPVRDVDTLLRARTAAFAMLAQKSPSMAIFELGVSVRNST